MELSTRLRRILSRKHEFSLLMFKNTSLLQSHFLKHVAAGVVLHTKNKAFWLSPNSEHLNDRKTVRSKLKNINCPVLPILDVFDWDNQTNPCGNCKIASDCFLEMHLWIDQYISAAWRTANECFGQWPRHVHLLDKEIKGTTGDFNQIICLSDSLVLLMAKKEHKKIGDQFNVVTSHSRATGNWSGKHLNDIRREEIYKLRDKLMRASSMLKNGVTNLVYCTRKAWLR